MPKVLVERRDDSIPCPGAFQQPAIRQAWAVDPSPLDIVFLLAKSFDRWQREILVRQNFALGLSRRQRFQDQLGRQTSAANHGLASQYRGIDDNALRPWHKCILATQRLDIRSG